MYPYHGRIKQRINNNEFTHLTYANSYNHIKEEVMLLHFTTEPLIRPIRKRKWGEYLEILN